MFIVLERRVAILICCSRLLAVIPVALILRGLGRLERLRLIDLQMVRGLLIDHDCLRGSCVGEHRHEWLDALSPIFRALLLEELRLRRVMLIVELSRRVAWHLACRVQKLAHFIST